MLMINFLRNRKSVRSFRDKKVDAKTLAKIKEAIAAVQAESIEKGIVFNLYEDGKELYERLKGKAGYGGVMIKSPHYIGVEMLKNSEKPEFYGAYYLEKLITKMADLELGNCWVSVKSANENDFLNTSGGNVDYVLAIGYPKIRTFFKHNMDAEKLGLTQVVFQDEVENPIDPAVLEKRRLRDMFYYIRYAPSSFNRYPLRYLIKDNKVIVLYSYDEERDIDMADAGIGVYYLEALASSKGINAEWSFVSGEYKGKEKKYRCIAEFKL